MPVPDPTPIYRFIHVDSLQVLLKRQGLHAPNHTPEDGLPYRTIHNVDIQKERRGTNINCGPDGVIHDYVPFYFGYRSPMLLQLHTGRVEGYTEGQVPIIYVESTAQRLVASRIPFVFSDGHGIAAYTSWYDDLSKLDNVDWDMVYQRFWKDTVDDMDRQRRKQAEFLVHRFCPWELITDIGVINDTMKTKVEEILSKYPPELNRPVATRRGWYY